MTTTQLASAVGCSDSTITGLCRRDLLPHKRVPFRGSMTRYEITCSMSEGIELVRQHAPSIGFKKTRARTWALPNNKDLFTIPELCDITGLSDSPIYTFLKSHDIKTMKNGTKGYITRQDAQRVMEHFEPDEDEDEEDDDVRAAFEAGDIATMRRQLSRISLVVEQTKNQLDRFANQGLMVSNSEEIMEPVLTRLQRVEDRLDQLIKEWSGK